ncbi:MAG: mannitol dehydrogenase family protein [Micropruina sp.]|uniref:mannitol dehydrogenase family protein n=1 Tax=Micropruina sp. TaxID=2737536 RepID=UPI0039E70C17
MARRLSRAQDGRPAPPVRIVHLGLGDFFRSHQAWYTDRAADADRWGIAAFSGRSKGINSELARQENLYTLVGVGPERNDYRVVSSIAETHSGTDVDALLNYLADPQVTVVTLTITEAGYRHSELGRIDLENDDVAADVAAIEAGNLHAVRTAPGKLVAGLIERRRAGAGPITLVSCDNMPDNGTVLSVVLGGLARRAAPDLVGYLEHEVGFVTTIVDRITPRASDAVRQAVLDERGVDDQAALATEPFSEWVLAGEFRGPRPDWESAGAEVVDDLVPYELRRLWLRNGAQSLMAYAGTIRGHQTVADAIADPVVRGWVEEWWDVAQRQLSLDEDAVTDYRTALLARFGNPRMRNRLSRIAADGSQKVPVRIVPALLADRAAGNSPLGAERAVAAWTLHLRGNGTPFNDAGGDTIRALGEGTLGRSVNRVCEFLEITDRDSRASILALAGRMEG